jgi:signal transduction histidine kinase
VDSEAYVVYFDNNNKVKKIVTYTPNGLNQNEIINLAKKFMENKTENNNLYFDDYVYSVSKNKIVIVDNITVKSILLIYLRISIILFLLFEILSIFISKKLTNWLVTPVVETFDKQRQFIYDISHELKTPLSVITANAEMIECDNKNKKWVNNIKDESERMNKLVISLLDLLMSNNINEEEKFTKVN